MVFKRSCLPGKMLQLSRAEPTKAPRPDCERKRWNGWHFGCSPSQACVHVAGRGPSCAPCCAPHEHTQLQTQVPAVLVERRGNKERACYMFQNHFIPPLNCFQENMQVPARSLRDEGRLHPCEDPPALPGRQHPGGSFLSSTNGETLSA